MAKKRGLNRGLEALLQGAGAIDLGINSPIDADAETLRQIPIEWMQRGVYQPRKDMDTNALEELAASIKQHGIMQPIIVRKISDNRFEIIAGERRWRASQIAGLDKIPCIVRDVDDESTIAMALIENIQREDLNAMEEAVAMQRLQSEFELTQQQVAEAVGKSRSAVANLLRLLQLDEPVRLLLERGDIDMGHARSLLALPLEIQSQVAREVSAKGLSVRQTEQLVKRSQQPQKTVTSKTKDVDVLRLQEQLSESLGAKVTIKQSNKGGGELAISYASLDEFEGILARIGLK